MKTKIFIPFGISRLFAMLIFLVFASIGICALIISFAQRDAGSLVIAFTFIGIAAALVYWFMRPMVIFKGNKLILYGNNGDYRKKVVMQCSSLTNCNICRNRDEEERIYGISGARGFSCRTVTLYAKVKRQSPFHISLDGFTKKQRQKIVAEIEKRRDYYAPIIEKERQEKIKAKLQEQKNQNKQ